MIIYRYEYGGSTQDIVMDTNTFTNLYAYSSTYELIGSLESAVILMFFFNIINHISYISNDFRTISRSLIPVRHNII